MQMTSDDIKTATRTFNADYLHTDNLAARIDAGEAVIWVACYGDLGVNTGGRFRAIIHIGVRDTNGHFIDGAEPDAHTFNRKDGRTSAADNGRRIMRPRWNSVYVPIEYTADYPKGTMIRDEPGPDGKPARRTCKNAA